MHAFAFGAHAVELEVDTQTGEITLLKSVYAADIGKAINPIIVEGQMEGAAVQAMGWALMEEHFMKDGKMENASFHNFLIPTSLDVPPHTSIIVECPNELGPYGAKGIGEPGIIPGAPAIRNAFWDATGVKMNTIPLTPVRVLEALENKKLEERGENR
jgi:CO/xanthine dehydrogenase Mo-binding subunit